MRPSPQTITENPRFFIIDPLIAGPEKRQFLASIGYGYEDVPMAKPKQKATSPIAYTPPYTELCLLSTIVASSGIMELSTMPMANPSPAMGNINSTGFTANGI